MKQQSGVDERSLHETRRTRVVGCDKTTVSCDHAPPDGSDLLGL